IDLEGRRVILLHYGERSETLAETLRARKAQLEELWLYRWLMPANTEDPARLVASGVSGEVAALTVTCQTQFRPPLEVGETIGLARALVRALDERVVVAAVGPTCEAIVRAYGVRVEVVPEHPKMGPLVVSLMRHLELWERRAEPAAFKPITH